MNYIRDNLAVCGFTGIGSKKDFLRHGFRAQLQCAEPFDPWLPDCVEVLRAPFDDGAPIPERIFRRARDWLEKRWDLGNKMLISCAGGQSRSVTMAIALLRKKERLHFASAAHEVMDRVPGAYPHPHVLVSAARYCGESLNFNELQGVYARVKNQPPYPWTADLLREALRDTDA